MSEEKRKAVFRNPFDKIFYVRKRPDQTSGVSFAFGPGMTLEAQDEAEEAQWAAMGLVDVAKEAPQIGNALDSLQKQLEEARAENASLKAEKSELEKKAAVVKPASKSSRK